MTDKQGSLWLIGMAVLALSLASLGCSICPFVPPLTSTPTPSLPPPTSTPAPADTATPKAASILKPTPAPETLEMVLYTNLAAGFSVLYPEDWVYDAEAEGVFFSESEEALETSELAEAQIFAVLAGTPEDIEYEFGTVETAQDLLDVVLEGVCEGECEIGQNESWTFGETPGVGVKASWRDVGSEVWIQTYVVAGVSDEVAGIGLAAAPEDDWLSYEPIFQDMFASLEFFPPELPEPVERGPIQPGETVQGTLPVGGREVWTFEVQEGRYVTIWLDAVVSEGLDAYLELYDEAGCDEGEAPIAEDDDGGAGTNSLIFDFRIDVSGTYCIYALTYSGEGDYQLGLEIADRPSGGGEIGYGETVEATIRGGGKHEWEFSGEAGDEISIAMDALEGELDSYLELYSPGDDLLIYDDDSGKSLDALIEYFVLPVDGSYRIVASDISGESGGYELTLEMAQLEIEGSLIPDQAVAATLEPGARHHWLFEGEAGDIVTISTIALDEELDTFLELFAPNGEQVTTDDDGGGDSNAAILEFELARTGTYRVVVRGYSDEQVGEYELALEMTQLEIEGTLVYGEVASAMLEPGKRHHWLFEGEAGDVVTISMIAVDEDMDTYLELFAPGGYQVITDDDSGGDSNAAILEYELPLSGTYRVVARGYSDTDTGEYELTLTKP